MEFKRLKTLKGNIVSKYIHINIPGFGIGLQKSLKISYFPRPPGKTAVVSNDISTAINGSRLTGYTAKKTGRLTKDIKSG